MLGLQIGEAFYKLVVPRSDAPPVKVVTAGDSETNRDDVEEHVITKDLEDQHGAIWSEQKIDFNENFMITADIYLGTKEGG